MSLVKTFAAAKSYNQKMESAPSAMEERAFVIDLQVFSG